MNLSRRGVLLHAEDNDEGEFSAVEDAMMHRKKAIRDMLLSFSRRCETILEWLQLVALHREKGLKFEI